MHAIDTALLERLHRICAATDYGAPINVIAAYRCPATNDAGGAQPGVARNSFHLRGMTIDIRLPERRSEAVRDAARRW
jgi:uncharacterized protein YcbK (DUF882 family)